MKSKVRVYYEELQAYCNKHNCDDCPYDKAGCDAVGITNRDTKFSGLTKMQIQRLEALMSNYGQTK